MVPSSTDTTEFAAPAGMQKKTLANFFIGLAVFLGGFVLFEPAPYEVFLAGLLVIGLLFGLRVPAGILPVIIPVTFFTLGGLISAFQIEDYSRGLIYSTVTLFLGLTTVFFAILIANDMGRLRLILRVYVAAAVITALAGIAGYFGMPGFEIFTRYGRAQGVFADPNVFAPFLIPAILYLMYGIMNRSVTILPVRLLLIGILLLGELLAYSRAGWGLTVFTTGVFYLVLIINERDPGKRAKYFLFGVMGFALIVIALLVALQFESIYSIFSQRAQIIQDYDGDRLGRFARHLIGFELSLSNPLGIGSLEFGFLYGEDEHNVYLRSLLTYGWIGFVSWMTLVLWPLITGFRLLFVKRPWQVYFQVAYVAFAGHLIIAWVIDIDHWRHFYLILGMIWGCILLEKKHARAARNQICVSGSSLRALQPGLHPAE